MKLLKSKAIAGANLADNFANGMEKLIPVVVSHGVIGTNKDYQMLAHEFAANGHIVFCITHLDGSSCYAELEDGSTKEFNAGFTQPHRDIFYREDLTDAYPWFDTITCREKEMSNLISEILDKQFLKDTLNFGSASEIDETKIIAVGHSHGGATVMKVGDSDERIRCVIAFDPWCELLNPWLDYLHNLVKKPMHLCQSQWLPHEEQFELDLQNRFCSRINNDAQQFENILVDKTHHMNQMDSCVIFALEMELAIIHKKFNDPFLLLLPRGHRFNLYQYFIHLSLRYLHRQALTSESGSTLHEIEKRLERFKDARKGQTGYVWNPAGEYYKEFREQLKWENSEAEKHYKEIREKREEV